MAPHGPFALDYAGQQAKIKKNSKSTFSTPMQKKFQNKMILRLVEFFKIVIFAPTHSCKVGHFCHHYLAHKSTKTSPDTIKVRSMERS